MSKLYAYNKSMENSNAMFWTPVHSFFPQFLKAQNILQVIETKII